MSSIELVICAILVAISAFMSASEVALFSLSRFQLRYLKDNFRSVHRRIKLLLTDPGGLLISILLINEVVNISLSALVMEVIHRYEFHPPAPFSHMPSWAFEMVLGTMITAPIVLLFCDITPKVVGAKMNQLLATGVARPLYFLYQVLIPIRFFITEFIYLLIPPTAPGQIQRDHFSDRNSRKEAILKESEFMLMLEEGHKEGAIGGQELDLIRRVFELDDITVADLTTPLQKVQTLHPDLTVKGALHSLQKQKHSRIPVVQPPRKEVVGILYSKDLLKTKLDPDLSQLSITTMMRKPFFVQSTLSVGALFRKLKQLKTHMAVVKKPNGEILGIITMNDILDTLFEDLFMEPEAK